MNKPNLISGIQPTGRLHLGNYLGALKNFVDLQNSGKYNCLFFLADLHSLTENPKPEELKKNIISLTAGFLAAGLNPEKSVVFLQSHVPAHAELAWILNTITPFGELRRMTQFKDKAKINSTKLRDVCAELIKSSKKLEHQKNIIAAQYDDLVGRVADLLGVAGEHDELQDVTNTGLFNYPVLMAADILLYDAAFVPVGEDQLQHLELTRTLARKFNTKFGRTFMEPKPLMTATPRLMSLDDPNKKMSKSRPEGCLFIDDPEAVIKDKIKRAVTDSDPKAKIKYDEKNKPAISNLLSIYADLSGEAIKKLEAKFEGAKYSEFKAALAELVTNYFAGFREKKTELMSKPKYLIEVLKHGSAAANKIASAKIEAVKNAVGIATNLL